MSTPTVDQLLEVLEIGTFDYNQHNLKISKNMIIFDNELVFSGLLSSSYISKLFFALFGYKDTSESGDQNIPTSMIIRSYIIKNGGTIDINVIANTNGLYDLVSEDYITDINQELVTIPSSEYTPYIKYYLDGRGTDELPENPYPDFKTVDLPYFQIGKDGGAFGVQVDGGFTETSDIIPDFTHRRNRIVAETEVTINEAIYELADLQINNIVINNPRHNKFHIFDSQRIDPTLPDDVYKFLDVSMESNVIDVPVKFSVSNWDGVVKDSDETQGNVNMIDYSSNSMELRDYSGGYGTAIDGNTNIWIADFELDLIYKYDRSGNRIVLDNGQKNGIIDIRAYGKDIPYLDSLGNSQYTWFGPNDITIDRDNNIYVSMYTTPYVAKINSEGILLSWITSSEYNDLLAVDDYTDELIIPKVTAIEALDDGIIVIAYDGGTIGDAYISVFNNGTESTQIGFTEDNALITNIIPSIDDLNKFYITLASDKLVMDGGESGVYEIIYNGVDTITKTLITATKLDQISYITIDANKSLWVCHGYNKVSVFKYDEAEPENYIQFGETMEIETSDATYAGNFEDDVLRYAGVNVFGGISYDLSGWITILQGFDNTIIRADVQNFMENASTDTASYLLYFNEGTTNYGTWIVSDFSSLPSFVTGTAPFKSIQANGDWSGVYWQYKYGSTELVIPDDSYTALTLKGESSVFAVTSIDENKAELTRQGETISMIDQLKSYILQEPLNQYTTLWDDLMYNIIGDENRSYQTFGKQFYEKITNFVRNHSDIDTANIRPLYSNINMLGNSIVDYNYNYPPDIARLMDIVSIPYTRLVGSRRTCNRNYSQDRYYNLVDQAENYENVTLKNVRCLTCGAKHPSNLGLERDMNTYIMSVGTPFIIRDTFSTTRKEYQIFYPTPDLNGNTVSYIDTFNFGFRKPFVDNYQIYDFVDITAQTIQDNGILSLDSPNTDQTILDISDIAEWFDSGGKVESLFAATLSNILGIEPVTPENIITVLSASLMVNFIDITGFINYNIENSLRVNVPVTIEGNNNTYLSLFNYVDESLVNNKKILEFATYNSTSLIVDENINPTKYLKVYIYGLPLYVKIVQSTSNTFNASSTIIDAIFESASIASDDFIAYNINKAIGVRFNGGIYYMPLYIGNE